MLRRRMRWVGVLSGGVIVVACNGADLVVGESDDENPIGGSGGAAGQDTGGGSGGKAAGGSAGSEAGGADGDGETCGPVARGGALPDCSVGEPVGDAVRASGCIVDANGEFERDSFEGSVSVQSVERIDAGQATCPVNGPGYGDGPAWRVVLQDADERELAYIVAIDGFSGDSLELGSTLDLSLHAEEQPIPFTQRFVQTVKLSASGELVLFTAAEVQRLSWNCPDFSEFGLSIFNRPEGCEDDWSGCYEQPGVLRVEQGDESVEVGVG